MTFERPLFRQDTQDIGALALCMILVSGFNGCERHDFSSRVINVDLVSGLPGAPPGGGPPHFHAKYSGYEARFSFSGEVLEGELPMRARKFVQEWIALHQQELEENWNRAQNGQSLNYIAPLE